MKPIKIGAELVLPLVLTTLLAIRLFNVNSTNCIKPRPIVVVEIIEVCLSKDTGTNETD